MSAPRAFEREPYLTELSVRVAETGIENGQPWAVLDDTVLYPEGGGQPADRGLLGGVPVLDVQVVDGAIRHLLASPVSEGPFELQLDWNRRFDHMQQHTAQHLLTAVAADRLGWETTAFHLGPETCDVELAVASVGAGDLLRLEDEVAAEIRAARPVTQRRVRPDEMGSLPVRSRGLPEGHEGDVRLVEIEGIDLNTCGGTHLRATSEIEALKLLGTEKLRGGTRLFFVAGGRIRRRLGGHEERSGRLRVLLGAPTPASPRPSRRSSPSCPTSRGPSGRRKRLSPMRRPRRSRPGKARSPRLISTDTTWPSCSVSASASPRSACRASPS
ncbi:MAG: alanyl-tRNA editing protein [Holophagales bacterium]|nr:alanyl-tRNA editing protein [Holophagales bacterium]